MKHSKQVCRCEAYKWPHRRDIKRCVVYEEVRTAEDERLDDPRRGQADSINRENNQWRQR